MARNVPDVMSMPDLFGGGGGEEGDEDDNHSHDAVTVLPPRVGTGTGTGTSITTAHPPDVDDDDDDLFNEETTTTAVNGVQESQEQNLVLTVVPSQDSMVPISSPMDYDEGSFDNGDDEEGQQEEAQSPQDDTIQVISIGRESVVEVENPMAMANVKNAKAAAAAAVNESEDQEDGNHESLDETQETAFDGTCLSFNESRQQIEDGDGCLEDDENMDNTNADNDSQDDSQYQGQGNYMTSDDGVQGATSENDSQGGDNSQDQGLVAMDDGDEGTTSDNGTHDDILSQENMTIDVGAQGQGATDQDSQVDSQGQENMTVDDGIQGTTTENDSQGDSQQDQGKLTTTSNDGYKQVVVSTNVLKIKIKNWDRPAPTANALWAGDTLNSLNHLPSCTFGQLWEDMFTDKLRQCFWVPETLNVAAAEDYQRDPKNKKKKKKVEFNFATNPFISQYLIDQRKMVMEQRNKYFDVPKWFDCTCDCPLEK